MLHPHKNNLFIFLLLLLSISSEATENPYDFIDENAQKMADLLTYDSDLFKSDRQLYEEKIKEIFDPMIDFRRVSAMVMGKEHYMMATTEQRSKFVEVFRESLLDTYAETLAQWGNSKITTQFPEYYESKNSNIVEVKQILDTGNSKYPISYKLRKNNEGWKIVNIIINGVNLGLTFRNQFESLASANNNDIDLTIENWVSDAGDAGIE